MVSWKVGSWVRGVQEATTTRFRLCSLMRSLIIPWASWEQAKRLFSTCSTKGRVLAYSRTASTSTTLAILMPQWQTKTPTRGTSWETSRSAKTGFFLARESRAADGSSLAAEAAAEASITDWGMSLGPWKAPQTKTPGRLVDTGVNEDVSADWSEVRA